MNTLIFSAAIALLSSCSTTHHHHYGQNQDRIMEDRRIVHHDYVDYGDHIQVIVKHRPPLSKQERKKLNVGVTVIMGIIKNA
jgi:hypothetical protein